MASERATEKTSMVEEKQLRDYELVLIISPEVVSEALDTAVENVNQSITEKGGIIADVEQLGKKKLAYPIRHFAEGSYVLIRFKLKPALTKELEAKLGLSEEVLRHLLVRLSS